MQRFESVARFAGDTKLQPESALTGVFEVEAGHADVDEVMQVIEAARREEAARQAGRAEAAGQR